jgi:hypothetical protein
LALLEIERAASLRVMEKCPLFLNMPRFGLMYFPDDDSNLTTGRPAAPFWEYDELNRQQTNQNLGTGIQSDE